MRRFKLLNHPVDDSLIPVVTTEMCVAVRALYFKHSIADFEHAHVERSAAQVENQNSFVFAALVKPVRKRSGGWFVNNAQHFETGNLSGLFGCGSLCVVKICGHRDHGLSHCVAQVRLGVALQLHECSRADFLWRVLLAVYIVGLPVLAHVPFDAAKGAVWVSDGLALCHFANQYFAGLRKCHDRRGGA